ncbi:MAG TPA: ribosome maturation factor RimM [Fimbriimonadaceae bacterium]|nr:ribosome maturation factor RimM [Fimbriimonadaceae bacterium]HRJ33650.1 ribosome maturation factor RimM [Fimbriimonadaceae bacterium]
MSENASRFEKRIQSEASAAPASPQPASSAPVSKQGRAPIPSRPRRMADPPEDHVVIGQVVGSFGLKGWLKIQPMTDFYERFDSGETVFIGHDPYEVVDAELHRSQLRLKVRKVTSIDQAEELRWLPVSVPKSQRPVMEEDEYYTADLLGCEVRRIDGRVLGKLDEVVPSPAQDLLRIGDIFLPFIREFIEEVNLQERVIVVKTIPGLLPDEPGEEAL